MSRRRRRRNRARAAYRQARPTSDNFAQFREAKPETTLQTLPTYTRESLQVQARAELTGNPHAGGIARLFGLYVVGVGPRLKFKGFPKYRGIEVERGLLDYVNFRWERYADAIQLASLLRLATQTLVVDGEAFLCAYNNPRIKEGIGLQLIDSLRVGNPDYKRSSRTMRDGVFLDELGNPQAYCVYRVPDDEGTYYRPSEYEIIGANQMFHVFREDLPGQVRGASWFQSAILLLQQLREYTAAVVETAKRSAKLVSTIETQQGIPIPDWNEVYNDVANVRDSGKKIAWDSWGKFNTGNGDSLILPPGSTFKTFNPTQPTAEASAFTSNILGQIGYSMGLPRNKATGSSHEYNFASGRLDNQPFEMLIQTLRLDLFERRALDKLFLLFYEAIAPDVFARFEDAPDEIEWEWIWPEPPLIDPESQARTNSIKLQSMQTTLSEVWNATHPFSEFSDKREEILQDAKDFPSVFGVEKTNTAIDEPKAQSTPNPEELSSNGEQD